MKSVHAGPARDKTAGAKRSAPPKNDKMIRSARALAVLGFAVHALEAPPRAWCPFIKGEAACQTSKRTGRCTCPGKAPIVKAWAKRPWTPPEQLEVRGGNIGIHCGFVEGAPLSIVVVDGDSAEALEAMRRRLPPTPIRSVTRTGEHWYYRHPGRGVHVDTRAHIDGIALDVRADGGQVVAPPSVHPSGHVYREADPWTPEAVAAMPTFDPAWTARPPAPAAPARRRPASPRTGDRAQLLRRGAAYARKADPAVEGQGGSTVAFKLAGHLVHELGLTVDEAVDVMASDWNARCSPPWELEGSQGLRRKVQEAADKAHSFEPGRLRDAAPPAPPVRLVAKAPDIGPPSWEGRLIRDDKGRLRPVAANVITTLSNHPAWADVLAYNEFKNSVEALRPPPWYPDDMPGGGARAGELGDEDAVRVQNWLARACNFSVSKQVIMDALPVVAQRCSFHPVRRYLDGLRWDGQHRLHRWLTYYMGVEHSAYTARVGRWWMVSAVARVMPPRGPKDGGPGCLVKTVLVLEGPQDLRKSTACYILGGDWFTDTAPNLHSKDAYGACRGVWIYELAELDALNRFESAAIKSYLSKRSDYYRPPYARSERDFPRQCVFIGTINPGGTGWSNDETGASRFWPVRCTAIDAAALAADRDQLWAEAVHLYRAGERWWPEGSEEADDCRAEQADRYQADAREGIVARWLESPEAEAHIAQDDLTSDAILSKAFKLEPRQMDRSQQIAVGIIMHRFGWERARQSTGARLRVYRRPTNEAR